MQKTSSNSFHFCEYKSNLPEATILLNIYKIFYVEHISLDSFVDVFPYYLMQDNHSNTLLPGTNQYQ